MSEWTQHNPAPGVEIWQPRRGFRYGAEAFWLAGFALQGGRPATALDLGTGSGIVAALLAANGVNTLGVDLRSEWLEAWSKTLEHSQVSGALDLEVGDVKALRVDPVDLVVSNPPFFPAGSGPRSPDAWKAAARHETTATLADFVRTARSNLVPSGRACFVVPADRGHQLIHAAPDASVRRAIWVGKKRVLIELVWSQEGGQSEADPLLRAPSLSETDAAVQQWYAQVGATG